MDSLAQASPLPRRGSAHLNRYLLWPAGGVLLLMLSSVSSQNITSLGLFFAGVLLSISIQSYISWSQARSIRVPVWTLLCAAHFVFYGVAIFGALRTSPSIFDRGRDLPDSVLATAMLVGIVGLLSMGAGRTLATHLIGHKGPAPPLS